jgi:AraC-like DNA-binding protein
VICLGGISSFCCGGVRYELQPGEFVVHNACEEHESIYGPHGPSVTVGFFFHPSVLLPLLPQSFASKIGPRIVRFPGKHSDSQVVHLAAEAADEITNRRIGRDVLVQAIALELLVHCIRLIPDPVPAQPADRISPQLHSQQFSLVLDYMESRGLGDFSLSDLCRFIGTSRSRLSSLFRNSTQLSPKAYFHRVLIKRAEELLKDDDISVKEVAGILGFRDSGHFGKVFRTTRGVTPGEFRGTVYLAK